MSSRSIMGFDYGTKSIGVAIGQELTGTAQPLRAIKANDGIPNWDDIDKLLKEWQPDLLVVGLPLNMDGTEQEITVRARKFGNRLHGTSASRWSSGRAAHHHGCAGTTVRAGRLSGAGERQRGRGLRPADPGSLDGRAVRLTAGERQVNPAPPHACIRPWPVARADPPLLHPDRHASCG